MTVLDDPSSRVSILMDWNRDRLLEMVGEPPTIEHSRLSFDACQLGSALLWTLEQENWQSKLKAMHFLISTTATSGDLKDRLLNTLHQLPLSPERDWAISILRDTFADQQRWEIPQTMCHNIFKALHDAQP